MAYVPSTFKERQEMLAQLNKKDIDELFDIIPDEIKLKRELNIPMGKTEFETLDFMNSIAEENVRFKTIFRGAGAYRHLIPTAVKHLSSRAEFVTTYTPYQAELSQGVLQTIFEYQSMICELTGMDVSNASIYDGASAAAEAVLMCKDKKRNRALISKAINPNTMEVIKTYANAYGLQVEEIEQIDGRMDIAILKNIISDDVCCIYSEMPNYYGLVNDVGISSEIAHLHGAKCIVGVNPIALGIFKTPGELGADIAVGEGQPLGMPLGFGGPYLGFIACKGDLIRKLPGRIVGETIDKNGKRAFVLTLQAREQHIRREKASSSICSNQALCALTAGIYLSTLGPEGLKEVATQCISKAHYMAEKITSIDGYDLVYDGEFFHEFVTTYPKSVDINKLFKNLENNGILGGLALDGEMSGHILWCATEANTKQEIDALVEILKRGVK